MRATLFALLWVAMVTSAVVVGVDFVSRDPDPATTTCPDGTSGDTVRTTRLGVDNTNVDAPTLTAVTVVTVARAHPVVADLLAEPEDGVYQAAMNCLLNGGDPQVRWKEKRESPPRITIGEETVTVTDTVRVGIELLGDGQGHGEQDLCEAPGYGRVWHVARDEDAEGRCVPDAVFGPWEFYQVDDRHWHFVLRTEPDLWRVPWREIVVEHPEGWLSSPSPPPGELGRSVATWRQQVVTASVSFTLTPDLDGWGAGVMSGYPERITRDLLGELWAFLALLAGLVLHLRWGRRDRALVAVPVAFAGVHLIRLLAYELLGPPVSNGTALTVFWSVSSGVLIIAAFVILWAGRLPLRKAGLGVFGALAGTLGAGLAGWRTTGFPDDEPGALPWTLAGIVAADLLLTALLVAAWINGMRGAFLRVRGGAVPRWVWAASWSLSTLTVGYSTFALARDRLKAMWLAEDQEVMGSVTSDLLWMPFNLITWFSVTVLWLWPVTVLAVALRTRSLRLARERPGGPGVRALLVWVFMANGYSWSHFYGGLWLPVPLVAGAVTLWTSLAVTRPWVLSARRLTDGRPLHAELRSGTLERVRRAAGRYLWVRRSGREWDARPLDSVEGLDDWYEGTEALRAEYRSLSQGASSGREVLPADITPLDLALLAGPDRARDAAGASWRATRHADLAWRAGRFALALGLVPAAYLLWHDIVLTGGLGGQDWFAGLWRPVFAFAELSVWFVPGYLMGLFWGQLPGRRGPIKALPFIVTDVVYTLVRLGLDRVFDLGDLNDLVVRTVLLSAVLTATGLYVDACTMRHVLPPWSRVGRYVMDIYRLETIPSQLTFLLAQIAAVLAIIQFVSGGGGEPPAPGVDPFQVPRPN
ncbi:DUF6185 family protein [Nonomuraea dietziae]|uniref:DUF6185 family protein n=1 Tax=Nonomuraea dietziae TaxID=65515 RepID=UPI0034063E70